MMLTLFAASVSYGAAFAQENVEDDSIVDTQRHLRPHSIVAGAGAVVNEDDQAHRSHFKLGLIQESDSVDADYTVKRGKFVAGFQDNRHVFAIIPDTWIFEVNSEDSFKASGIVENKDGEAYVVEISGEKIHDLQRGNLYYVTGLAYDDEKEFDLFYIAAMFDRNPQIKPSPATGEE